MRRTSLALALIVLLQLSATTCIVEWASAGSLSYVYIPSFGYLAINIFTPEQGAYVRTPVVFAIAASVHSGMLDIYQYSVDGGPWVNLSSTPAYHRVLLNLSSGFHNITAAAKFWGKRVYADVNFAVDVVPPYITTLSPENNTYNTSKIPLTFEARELNSKRYYLDNQEPAYVEGNTTLNAVSDGVHSLVLYGEAPSGTVYASAPVFFEVDTTPPQVTVFPIENKTYDVPDVPLRFTVDNSPSWLGYSLDNQPIVTITGNLTLTGLSYGLHELTVYANDTAGNMGYQSIHFEVNSVFPTTIVAAGVIATVVLASGLLVYLKKRKRSKSQ